MSCRTCWEARPSAALCCAWAWGCSMRPSQHALCRWCWRSRWASEGITGQARAGASLHKLQTAWASQPFPAPFHLHHASPICHGGMPPWGHDWRSTPPFLYLPFAAVALPPDPVVLEGKKKFHLALEDELLDYKHNLATSIEACANTLVRIFSNVLDNPGEAKYRQVGLGGDGTEGCGCCAWLCKVLDSAAGRSTGQRCTSLGPY